MKHTWEAEDIVPNKSFILNNELCNLVNTYNPKYPNKAVWGLTTEHNRGYMKIIPSISYYMENYNEYEMLNKVANYLTAVQAKPI